MLTYLHGIWASQEDGQTYLEYALIVVVISLGVGVTFGLALSGSIDAIGAKLIELMT